MSYPDYPNNRLIVNGEDLSEKFGLILLDGYTLSPPSPKTYTVDIPGGNGKLDLTETLIGDTVYDNRKQEFVLCVVNPESFERVKTQVSNFLHGRAYDYKFTMDPEYIYHGRFTVDSYSHKAYSLGKVGNFTISVESDPYKIKELQVRTIDAAGGRICFFESGRMRVRPTIECDGLTKVIFNNKLVTLQQGSWGINELLFTEGENEVYINSFDIRNYTWGEVKTDAVTWGEFKTKRLFEWYKNNGAGYYVDKTWSDMTEHTWDDIVIDTWSYHTKKFIDGTGLVKNVYIKYDWGDL